MILLAANMSAMRISKIRSIAASLYRRHRQSFILEAKAWRMREGRDISITEVPKSFFWGISIREARRCERIRWNAGIVQWGKRRSLVEALLITDAFTSTLMPCSCSCSRGIGLPGECHMAITCFYKIELFLLMEMK